MREIDESIRAALRDAALDSGSVLKLSRKLGVSHSTVLFWSSGRTRRIDGDVWRYKVLPALEVYLRRRGASLDTSPGDLSRSREKVPSAMHEVPVVALSQVLGYDPALEPFDVYARDCGCGTAFFAGEPRRGHFALRVEGRSMEPEFPDGTLILVAGGAFVESGDIVAARIRDGGRIFLGRYLRLGSKLRLEAINSPANAFEWNIVSERGFLEWIYPVIEAKVDLRSKRDSFSQCGMAML